MEFQVIAEMQHFQVLKREDGKFGLYDKHNESYCWRFRTEEVARENAEKISTEVYAHIDE